MTEPVRAHAARSLWWLFAVVAGAMTVVAIVQWGDALVTGRPIIYGEGAVAHAAILSRDGAAYRDTTGVVAANYPPLYLAASSFGDPFRVGRAVTILSALAVAVVVAWRAREAGPLASVSLAIGWSALTPVAIWGAALKPDMLAVALTLGGVALLDRSRASGRAAFAAGALLALAVWAKPTAALPAVAVLAWALLAARPVFLRAVMGSAIVGLLAVAHAAVLGLGDVWRHVVTWNALAWSAEQVVLVLVLGAATLGILLAAAVLSGAPRGIALAYLIGAVGVVFLAGREGATINYLLDLAAATSFALARVAPRLRASGGLPLAATAQILIVVLATPFGNVPGRESSTGAWGRPDRLEGVRSLGAGPHLVEDSGLLVALGQEPVIDDLFLWHRLAALRLIDTTPMVERARRGGFTSVVSEVDLSRIDEAPPSERARWHPDLVRAVLDSYALERRAGVLWIYRPR